jgi:ankyrin repeat protein
LYTELLRGRTRKKDVQPILEQLPKGLAALDDAYDKAIKQIDEQVEPYRVLARRVISTITLARRPLTVEELCHAVSTDKGDTSLDLSDVYKVETLISICAGLVTVSKDRGIVQLIHYTTQIYFQRILTRWHSVALEEMATTCLTYLSFDVFRHGSCSDNATHKKRLAENPYFKYAARHWSKHVRPVESAVLALTLCFLHDDALVESALQGAYTALYDWNDYYYLYFPITGTGLHVAAMWGLPITTKALLSNVNKVDVNAQNSNGQTALMLAAKNGHKEVVEVLLATGKAEINAQSKNAQTALVLAAENGYKEVAELLLATGKVETNDARDKNGLTALTRAALLGEKEVVELLLATGKVEINAQDKYGCTALMQAARWGHKEVVELLLATVKVEINAQDTEGWTALMLAAMRGYQEVVGLLLATGKVEIDAQDYKERTALMWAAEKGHEDVVELLEEYNGAGASLEHVGTTAPIR